MTFLMRIIREPLVHFLVIGGLLFLAFGLTQEQEISATNQIVVSSAQIEQLSAQFKRSSLRSPTQDELDKLIKHHIRDEVFYRQGMALGLDKDDPVVKQRLRMKLEVLLDDLSDQAIPEDNVLLAFMKENSERYRSEAVFSFQHIYLNPQNHKDLNSEIKLIKGQLINQVAVEALGDRLILPQSFSHVPAYDISKLFGEKFTEKLVNLSVEQWSPIIYSNYGAHIVKLSAYSAGQLFSLDEVKSEVLREYYVQQRNQLKDNAYKNLLDNYVVVIESAAVVPTKVRN